MSERYWITGVQLGMLKGLIQSNDIDGNCAMQIEEIIDKVIDEQFMGNINSQVMSNPQPVGNTHVKTGTTPDTHSQIKSIMDDSFKEHKK